VIEIQGSVIMWPMPAEPDAVVDALQVRLRQRFTVALEWLDQEPYAVVRGAPDEESWVNLAVSIAAFPSSGPDEIAEAIADAEKWD